MLKNTLMKKKSILFAGAALIVTLGIGIITMSGAKFTSDVDTGIRTITAGVLKPLDYSFEDVNGNPISSANVNDLFTNVYPGWTKTIDVVVKTTADTTLDANWAPLIGGGFTGTPSGFDDRITISVSELPIPVGDFTPEAGINGKSLAELSSSAVVYNDTTSSTVKYVKLGSGELMSQAGSTTKFRLTFSFKDADAGVTTFEGMQTYKSDELDNQYMGNTTAFNLVLKAVVLDQ